MEALVIGIALIVVAWRFAAAHLPTWVVRLAMRAVPVVVLVVLVAALLRRADTSGGAVLLGMWLLVGGVSFAFRRWIAGAKEREARRAALHAARLQARKQALPPPPRPQQRGRP